MKLIDHGAFPNLAKLIGEVLSHWPDHQRYLEKSLADRDAALMQHSERLSALIIRLSTTIDGGIAGLARDYRFLCEDIVLPEELYFRRNDRYRLDKFEDALQSVYANTGFMTRYMNGLLVSDVIWVNHCRGLQHYANEFLPKLKPGADLLEIGPGHGLLLYLACEEPAIGRVSAWDISDASLALSRHALDVLGVNRHVDFEPKNIFDPSIMSPENAERFDAIVLSEVLEHLERPEEAIRVLFHLCRPGGRIWINVPANSPAPDHLYLVRQPEQAEKLIRDSGFHVIETASFPMTGTTLERAIRQKLTITCIVSAEKPKS